MFKAFKWRTARQREEPAVPEVPAPDAVFVPEIPGNAPQLQEGSFYWYGPPPVYDVGYGQGMQPFYQPYPQGYGQGYPQAYPPSYPQGYPQPYGQPMPAPMMPMPMPLPVIEQAAPIPAPEPPSPPAATSPEPAKTSGAASPPSPPRRASLLRRLFNMLMIIIGFIVAVCASVIYYYSMILPDPRGAALTNVPPNLRIVAADGAFIAERGMRREYVKYDRLPRYLINAVIATEDRRFQYHFGFDPIGTARALLRKPARGRDRAVAARPSRNNWRRICSSIRSALAAQLQEVFVAMWLETKFSKNDIMELYLNRVYFGSGNYGIGAAAYHYFNKRVEQLTLAKRRCWSADQGAVHADAACWPCRDG